MLANFRRHTLYIIVAVLLFAPIVGVIFPAQTARAAVEEVENPAEQLERWLFYRGMRACLNDADFDGAPNDNDTRTRSQINDGKLNLQESRGFGYMAPSFEDNKPTGTVTQGNDNDGLDDCEDGSIWVRGATAFGFRDVMDLICTMNRSPDEDRENRIKPDPDGGPGREHCDDASEIEFDGGSSSFQPMLSWALENGGDKMRPHADIDDNDGPDYTGDALRYLIGWRSLVTFCSSGASLDDLLYETDNFEGNKVVSARYVKSDGTIDERHGFRIGGKNENNNWWDSERTEGSSVDGVWYDGDTDKDAKAMKCSTMAEWTRNYANAYASWAQKHSDLAGQNDLTPGQSTSDDPTTTPGENETTCAVDKIGWLICPVVEFLGSITDEMYKILATKLLMVQAGDIFDTSKGTYAAWSSMRNIANVAFVMAFLVIVYSQITGLGLSNYGVKKMLPKLVVTVILVNVSFWICAIAVDISNILGSSLKEMLDPGDGGFDFTITEGGTSKTGNGWTDLSVAILATAGLIYVGLSVLLPALVAVAFAVITVVIVLAARQAIIILLIVISPLAFVAYLLPNTEQWFKRWMDLFKVMLLMFPIISLIFGASALASVIIMEAADGSIVVSVIGALIAIVPLFITPIVMRTAGGVLNRVGGFINNPNKGPFDRLRKGAENVRANRQEYRKLKAMSGGPTLPGRGIMARRGARRKAILDNRQAELKRSTAEYVADAASGSERFREQLARGGGPGANQRALDQALNIKASIEAEEVKAAANRIERLVLSQDDLRQVALGGSAKGVDGADLATRKAAFQHMANRGDYEGMNQAWDNVKDSNNQELRSALADSLAASSNRPGWMSQGALQQMREGGASDSTSLVENAIKNNTYSAEKIAGADKDELKIVANVNNSSTNISVNEKQQLLNNAATAQTDRELSAKIGKNAGAIDAIRTNQQYNG